MLCKRDGCNNDEKYLRKGWCSGCYGRWKRTGSPVPVEKARTLECKFDSTHKGPFTKGYCKNCYYRVWHTGTADYKVRPRLRCSVVECDKWAVAKGLCDTHRKRVERKGDVNAGRPEGWGDRAARRERHKNIRLQKNFGITAEQYAEMVKEQGGVCKICKQPETAIDPRTGFVFTLSVDHDHDTGFVRGLLCTIHNRAIGLFQDNAELLQSAANYLVDSKRRQEE